MLKEEDTSLLQGDEESPTAELNDVVHQRTRLGLLVVLRETQQADFSYLKSRLKLTDGNLGQHIEILKHHGLVTIRKGHEGHRARTWVKITRAGEKALASEIEMLPKLCYRTIDPALYPCWNLLAPYFTVASRIDGSPSSQFGEGDHSMVVKYKKGDRLIYPHHGACTVEQISKISAFDVMQEYLTIRVSHSDLLIKVPVNNAESVGLRDVINDEEVEEVYAVLRKKDARTPTNWSRRFKNHSEKMRSGDIYQVAEVVRNLTIRNREHRLSNAEKHMLINARQVLVSELTFALNIDLPATEARLTEVLA